MCNFKESKRLYFLKALIYERVVIDMTLIYEAVVDKGLIY
jgi:hypothetical protein